MWREQYIIKLYELRLKSYEKKLFSFQHPGGADSLLEYAGKDGTQAFEDVAHSEDAR